MAWYRCGTPVQGGVELIPEGYCILTYKSAVNFKNEDYLKNSNYFNVGSSGEGATFIFNPKNTNLKKIKAMIPSGNGKVFFWRGIGDSLTNVSYENINDTSWHTYSFPSGFEAWDLLAVVVSNYASYNTDVYAQFLES